jgi:heat shock protein HslJ
MKTFSTMLLTIMLLTACGFAVTSQGDPLNGSTWQLQTIDRTGMISDTEITVVFRDGQIHGQAGCNNYYGSYNVRKDTISVSGPIGATTMACFQEGVMEQEHTFLNMLQQINRYERTSERLVLFTVEGEVLGFIRS